MIKLRLLIFALIVFSQAALAQKIRKESGDLSFLKVEKTLKVEYTYNNMGVGKFATEEAYVKEKVSKYEEKEKGKGEKWYQGWINARKNLYHPKFEELLNKYINKENISAFPSLTTSKYTLILHTTFTEPGFNVGVWRQPASINVEYIFVETAEPTKIVAKLVAMDIPGRDVSGYDFDAGIRITEAYAKAGKMLGKYILEILKK